MNTIIILSVLIVLGVGIYFLRKKSNKGVTKPEPIPEPPVIVKPKIFHIEIPDNAEDKTLLIREQLSKIPDGVEIVKHQKTYKVAKSIVGKKFTDSTFKSLGELKVVPNHVIFPKGEFWTEGDLENNPRGINSVFKIENRHNLIISGHGKETVFYTKAPATPYGGNVTKGDYSLRRHFKFLFCSNIVLENITIKGSNSIKGSLLGTAPEYTPIFWKGGKDNGSIADSPGYTKYWEQEHGVELYSCEDVLINNISVSDVWGDGFYIAGDSKLPSRNITISNSTFKYTGRQGGAASHVDGLLIDNVFIDRGRRSDLDFEPHKPELYVRNVEVKNSKFYSVGTVIAALGRGDVSNIYFHDNEYQRGALVNCWDSSGAFRRSNWRIENNIRTGSFSSTVSPIGFKKTDGIKILNNTESIEPDQGRNVASFINCGGNIEVSGNDFNHGKYMLLIDTESVKTENNTPELIPYKYGEKP
ncbi:right-handed parallel beta-helix repeat-containing protein [Salinimicrobium sp. GXAS 041]|uniref:right-handed parallel beta-helix repeat-containing protein n=1 Tax=Salinimicrobium sp. GXAS 041 TaxID=3400806 RepID=UPI003C7961EA